MTIHFLDFPFVAWYPVLNHDEIKEKYVSIIQEHKEQIESYPTSTLDNTVSSYFERHQHNPLKQQDLTDAIIWQPLDKLFTEFPFQNLSLEQQPKQSNITDIWWNYYYPNGFARPHKHNTSDFSGIYLLHNEEPNTTSFIQTSGESQYNYQQRNYNASDITEGHVIIFPSYLMHYTTPCTKNRIIVAWNVVTQSNWSNDKP